MKSSVVSKQKNSEQDEEFELDEEEDREADYVNKASLEIKAAIKYKLMDNMYSEYLGVHLPYGKTINALSGNVYKENFID